MAPIPRHCPGYFVDVGFGPLEGRLARCLALLAPSLGAGGPSAGWVAVGTGFGTGSPRWGGVAPLRGEVLWILGDQGSQLLESYWCYCGRDVDYFQRSDKRLETRRDFLSEGGQARTVSAVDAETVGDAEVLLMQRFASASRAALAAQSVRAVHWSWHRQ